MTLEKITTLLEGIDAKVDRMDKILTGNGTPERGLVIRVDRLEQQSRRAGWVIKSLIVAVFGGIVEFLLKTFHIHA